MDKKVKIACISAGSVAGILAIAYGAGAYYYKDRFFPNTTINGKDVSGLQFLQAEEVVSVPDGDAVILKERKNGEESISLDSIQYEVSTSDDSVSQFLTQQNLYSWPAHLFEKAEYTVELKTSFDSAMLTKEITKLKAMQEDKMEAPEDAYIDTDSNGVFEVVKEDQGTTLIQENVEKAVKEALKENILTVDLDEAGCYKKPEITSEDEHLNHVVDVMHALNNEIITLDLEDGVTEVVTPETLAGLFDLQEDGTATINNDALTQYVYDLADKYDTQFKTRQFVTSYGSEITVGGGSSDTYGYQMNLAGTIDLLNGVFTSGQTQTTQLYWVQQGLSRGVDQLNDLGNTYIEVSIGAQHLWAYINGQLYLESDVVTGLPAHGQDTPVGCFRILNRQRNAQLKGTAWNGETWDSPVAFWMPITWGGVGLHDATWQPAFGGTLYYTIGSHGCINLPYGVASSIFEAFGVGTPVIVY